MRRRRPRRLLPSLLALALILGCDTPTRPSDPSTLVYGRPITGHLAPGDSQVFHLDAKTGQHFAAYIQASAVTAILLHDPAQRLIGVVLAMEGDTATTRAGVPATAAADGRYTVVVASRSHSTGTDFTLRAELVDSSPEHVKPDVAMGEVRTGERIDTGFDEDQFIIDVPTGSEAELFVHGDSPPQSGLGSLGYSLRRSGVPTVIYAGNADPPLGGSDFQQSASGHLTLAAGKYALTVNGTYGIAYAFQLQPIRREPEQAAATLTPGDTVAESIDYVGDIDEYLLRGTPGTDYEVFVAASGAPPHAVEVSIPELAVSASAVLGQGLLDAATGRVTMPASGQLMVRVSDAADRAGVYRGPYRLVAVAIDRQPEARSAVIVPSAGVLGDAFEIYGDVDEYRLTLSSPQSLTLRCGPVPAGGCATIGAALFNDAAPSTPVDVTNGRDVPVPAGAYRLRIQSHPNVGGPTTANGMYRGPYQVVLAGMDTLPEDGPQSLAVGTPVNESFTWPWDADVFRFDVATADTILMHLVMSDAAGSAHRIDLRDAVTGTYAAPTDVWASDNTDRRIDLKAGHYEAKVRTSYDTWMPGARGRYELTFLRVSATPEGRDAAIAVGDTVRSVFELPGDIDDYVLTATPGKLVTVSIVPVLTPGYESFLSLDLVDPTSGTTLASVFRRGGPGTSAPAEIPPGGKLRVRACATPGCAGDFQPPPYAFVVDYAAPAP